MQDSSSAYSRKIAMFWKNAFLKASNSVFQPKECRLPLARIKRLMKVEEDVRMIASEVPVLFSAVTEVFIQELTARAWMYTEDGKRKILQSGDISFAARTSSMYDFLTFIIPSNHFPIEKYTAKDTFASQQYSFKDALFTSNSNRLDNFGTEEDEEFNRMDHNKLN